MKQIIIGEISISSEDGDSWEIILENFEKVLKIGEKYLGFKRRNDGKRGRKKK